MRLLALALIAAAAAPTATLRVHLRGLRSDAGKAGCTVYATAADFPKNPDKAVAKQWAPITKTAAGFDATCTFEGLAPGVYAVSVLHDENGNGTMDTGIFGIPKEGYGASGNKLPSFSPPKFDDAKLTVPAGPTEIDVTLRYP
jgi:uncharacterized protein (DUF2141 family)